MVLLVYGGRGFLCSYGGGIKKRLHNNTLCMVFIFHGFSRDLGDLEKHYGCHGKCLCRGFDF